MKRPFQSLYVHVPFCRAKCDYCAFYSIPGAGSARRQAYLDRLRLEFAEFAGQHAPLTSIFIGGGTPSLLPPRQLDELLRRIRTSFTLAADCEFTVECNPDSLTAQKIAVLARHGVNRVSLGVQSFLPAHRLTLGRQGSLDRLAELLAELRACGIRNLGMDLIYGIPGQTLADWESDLRRAIAFGIRHLSTYALTVEEATRLGRRGVHAAADALAVSMWERAADIAAGAALRRYEVSNLALPGSECRHNLEVWYGGTYLGCGPAAASFDGELRWTNAADLQAWLQIGTPREDDRLPPEARAAEILAFGLRTAAGWDRTCFRERTGFDCLALRGPEIAALAAEGFLELLPAILRPTPRGLLFADRVAERLL